MIRALPIELGDKMVSVEVEVFYASLDYNLLLWRIWKHAMMVELSLIFWVIKFPLEGNIVTIDQLWFYINVSTNINGETVPLVGNSIRECENVWVGMYPTVIGTFKLPPPEWCANPAHIHAISTIAIRSMVKNSHFRNSYFEDSWIVPKPTIGNGCRRAFWYLSIVEIAYEVVISKN